MVFSFRNESARLFNSDLAAERRRADLSKEGIEYRREAAPIGEWERIKVTTREGEISIGRPIGIYDTLTLPRVDVLDAEAKDDAKEAVARELCRLCDIRKIYPERILVVGLGNPSLTPDSVGSLCAKLVEPTLHISEFDTDMFEALECSEIAVISPGVSSLSGIDSADIVGGVSEKLSPDVVIAIDALAARSPKRLGTTLQFCDTGIHPGAGVGSHKRGIDEELLGVPVIAIGVPTVIDSRLLIEGEDESSGTSGMFVCPKEIDVISSAAAEIIAGGINQAFGIVY